MAIQIRVACAIMIAMVSLEPRLPARAMSGLVIIVTRTWIDVCDSSVNEVCEDTQGRISHVSLGWFPRTVT